MESFKDMIAGEVWVKVFLSPTNATAQFERNLVIPDISSSEQFACGDDFPLYEVLFA
jgi:hypothetical protein